MFLNKIHIIFYATEIPKLSISFSFTSFILFCEITFPISLTNKDLSTVIGCSQRTLEVHFTPSLGDKITCVGTCDFILLVIGLTTVVGEN